MIKAGITTVIGSIVLQTGVLAQLHVKNPGNVGIGISTPATRLHVNGVTTAGPAGGGYHLIINDVPTARWALGTGDHALHIANDYPVTTTWGDKLVINKEGNVGIGYTNPEFKLQVAGHTEIGDQNAHDPFRYGTLQLVRPANQGDDKYHLSFIRSGNSVTGIGYSSNSNLFGIWASAPQGTYSTPTIGILPNGHVGIGTGNPNYKLEVNGDVRGNTFIATAYNYPDYVFDSGYELPSLREVKEYIRQHHHLPGVPSEEEVKRDGLKLAEQQVILLKKVEELTLYAIDQNEKLQQLDQQMKELLKQNKKQKEEIENLKKKKTRRW